MEIFEKQYQEHGIDAQRKYPNEAMLRFLSTLPKGGKVLEIGCGSGANLWAIAREGFQAYGVDSSKTALELCKQMLDSYQAQAKLSLGDFRTLNFPDNSFDAIVDIFSLQHTDLQGHKDAIAEVYRCLKPGGSFFTWHLGKETDSSVYDSQDNGYYLTANELAAFLDGFKNASLTKYTRDDGRIVEYLAITATK